MYWQTKSGLPPSTPTRQSNVGRHEGLGEQEVGVLEHLRGERLRAPALSTFLTPREKDESGTFSTIGKPSSSAAGRHRARRRAITRRRHGDAVRGQQLVQVDLVGAADHRDRVVDDRHALLHGAAGEAVGVVVDRRRLADEQRVELGEPGEVAAGDRLDLDAAASRRCATSASAWRGSTAASLVRVVEHGEGIARRGALLLRAPFARGVVVQRLVEEGAARRGRAW